jgi:hypothetical protein
MREGIEKRDGEILSAALRSHFLAMRSLVAQALVEG